MSDDTPKAEINWRGPDDLIPLLVPLASVELDPRNARRHPDLNLSAIKRSIEGHGQLKPIVVKGSRILAGNGTWAAIKELGWNCIAVVRVPITMSDEEAVAYAIADNKTTDLSEWDFQELAELFKELPPELHSLTGFEPFEIEPLMRADFTVRDPSLNKGAESAGDVARGIVTFRVSLEQAMVINEAISRVRAQESATDMLEGRALELICADYLAGAPPEAPAPESPAPEPA